jgi:hypothetical protein
MAAQVVMANLISAFLQNLLRKRLKKKRAYIQTSSGFDLAIPVLYRFRTARTSYSAVTQTEQFWPEIKQRETFMRLLCCKISSTELVMHYTAFLKPTVLLIIIRLLNNDITSFIIIYIPVTFFFVINMFHCRKSNTCLSMVIWQLRVLTKGFADWFSCYHVTASDTASHHPPSCLIFVVN